MSTKQEQIILKTVALTEDHRRITGRKEEIEFRTRLSRSGVSRIPREATPALLNNVKKLARKMRMNLTERKPPRSPLSDGRILHTPTFRALAIPSPAVMNEVSKVN